jgi:hypothetical protein
MEAEVITPLSGPSYGAYSVARRRWKKPVPAIIADAVATCQGLSDRLTRGMHMPDYEDVLHYNEVYQQLTKANREQLKALEAFSKIAWRE